MAFTRYHYDEIRVKKNLQESTGPSRWILNKPGNGTPLFFDDPHIRMQEWGANQMETPNNHPIDISSELDGRSRKLSKLSYLNEYQNNGINAKKIENYPVYKKSFTQNSRFTNPSWLYRDLEQANWGYPMENPQLNTCIPFQNNLSTRILEKDNFVPNNPVPFT